MHATSLRAVFSYSYIRLSVLHFLQLMLYVLARSVRLFEEGTLFLCLHKRTIFVKYYKPTTCPPPPPRLEQLPTAASRNTLNEARRSLEMSMRRRLPASPTLAQPPHLWSSSPQVVAPQVDRDISLRAPSSLDGLGVKPSAPKKYFYKQMLNPKASNML